MPRYELLLKELLKNTPEQTLDCSAVSQAIELMQINTRKINIAVEYSLSQVPEQFRRAESLRGGIPDDSLSEDLSSAENNSSSNCETNEEREEEKERGKEQETTDKETGDPWEQDDVVAMLLAATPTTPTSPTTTTSTPGTLKAEDPDPQSSESARLFPDFPIIEEDQELNRFPSQLTVERRGSTPNTSATTSHPSLRRPGKEPSATQQKKPKRRSLNFPIRREDDLIVRPSPPPPQLPPKPDASAFFVETVDMDTRLQHQPEFAETAAKEGKKSKRRSWRVTWSSWEFRDSVAAQQQQQQQQGLQDDGLASQLQGELPPVGRLNPQESPDWRPRRDSIGGEPKDHMSTILGVGEGSIEASKTLRPRGGSKEDSRDKEAKRRSWRKSREILPTTPPAPLSPSSPTSATPSSPGPGRKLGRLMGSMLKAK